MSKEVKPELKGLASLIEGIGKALVVLAIIWIVAQLWFKYSAPHPTVNNDDDPYKEIIAVRHEWVERAFVFGVRRISCEVLKEGVVVEAQFNEEADRTIEISLGKDQSFDLPERPRTVSVRFRIKADQPDAPESVNVGVEAWLLHSLH